MKTFTQFIFYITYIFAFMIVGSNLAFASTQNLKDSTKKTYSISSPNRNLIAEFKVNADAEGHTRLSYTIQYKDKTVLLPSALDITMDNHLLEQALALKVPKQERWFDDLIVKNVSISSKDTIWKPLFGERNNIKDIYNQTIIHFQKKNFTFYQFNLEIRVYNEGVAFRYFFPENPTGVYYHIVSENSEFSLPADTKAWFTSWAQGAYRLLPLKNWPDQSERPLTLELNNGLKVSLLEANLSDFPRTKFTLSDNKENTIRTAIYSDADLVSSFHTPWRGIMVAETMAKLIENNDFILNLNDPSAIKNTNWIKPGKIIRETTLTTEGALASIDFAAAHKLQYILLIGNGTGLRSLSVPTPVKLWFH